MKHELWLEGFKMNGKTKGVEFWGEYEGETFMDAYLNMVRDLFGEIESPFISLDEPKILGTKFHNSEASAIEAAK